jgi:hypothetical protein
MASTWSTGLFLSSLLAALAAAIQPAGYARTLVPVSAQPDTGENPRAPAARETFESRVDLGRAAEQRPEFATYHARVQQELGAHYATTMHSCLTDATAAEIDAFTLVADITADGRLDAVAVRPATNIASCFAAGLVPVSFPKPPPYPGRSGFPIMIKMTITQ